MQENSIPDQGSFHRQSLLLGTWYRRYVFRGKTGLCWFLTGYGVMKSGKAESMEYILSSAALFLENCREKEIGWGVVVAGSAENISADFCH